MSDAQNKSSSRVVDAAMRKSPLRGRHASTVEILVAFLIILFALIFICKARGDERSAVPVAPPLHQPVLMD